MPAPAREPSPRMTALEILGTPLLLTDYGELDEQCRQWARAGACVALDFANTQIVTMRRHEPWFHDLTSAYDCFPPDGMPLIWCLRLAGARLRDRVYGPIFMRQFLAAAPPVFTHYLLGGSEACGAQLRAAFGKLNPGLRFVGDFLGFEQPGAEVGGLEAGVRNVREEVERPFGVDAGQAGNAVELVPGIAAALVEFGQPERQMVLRSGQRGDARSEEH